MYVTAIRSLADVPEQLGHLARVLGAADRAAPALEDLRAAIDAAERALPATPRPTIAFIGRDPWMAVGAETYAGVMHPSKEDDRECFRITQHFKE